MGPGDPGRQPAGQVERRPKWAILKKRIFIVEDQVAVRKGLVEILNREAEMMVCGVADDAIPALAAIKSARPDLVLVDIQLRSSDGFELICGIRWLYPAMLMVAMTMFGSSQYERTALAAGADGFVVKQEGPDKIIEAIRRVLT